MCLTPACRANLPAFKLSGPVGKPPQGGWKIRQLPEAASGLQHAWMVHPGKPQGARAAMLEMLTFLAHNDVSSTEISQAVVDIGIDQWCSGDPSRCEKKWRKAKARKIEPRFFSWARAAWEELNNSLPDETPVEALPHILAAQISKLTTLINPATNPAGCALCHSHWLKVLADFPLPEPLTLDAARRWVVRVHNETREGREPVPYEVIAEKFHWSDPAPEPVPSPEPEPVLESETE